MSEVACPFCATASPEQRPQHAYAKKLTRAAIFSAAVVGCSSKEQLKPAPPPPPEQTRTVEQPPPADAASADAPEAVAATADAGVPVDAGLDPEVAAEQRKRRMEGLRRQEQIEKERAKTGTLSEQKLPAKPYGAPPARRRVV